MSSRFVLRRSIHSVAQIVLLLVVIAAMFIVLDLNRRAKDGRLVGAGAEVLQVELDEESTRQVELQATLEFVLSDEYVAIYAREEGGMLLPGEKRIVPLKVEAAPAPATQAQATPDPALYARPWQVWWSLLSDAPLPSR
jgi:cell division protein FtsB